MYLFLEPTIDGPLLEVIPCVWDGLGASLETSGILVAMEQRLPRL